MLAGTGNFPLGHLLQQPQERNQLPLPEGSLRTLRSLVHFQDEISRLSTGVLELP